MCKVFIERDDRVFQMWAYSVSMRRLLLRSNKNDTFDTRVDVLFQNVKAISLPTTMEGLTVATAGDAGVAEIANKTGILPDDDKSFFELRTHGVRGYIIAGVVVEDEDHGEYFEPSRLWPE